MALKMKITNGVEVLEVTDAQWGALVALQEHKATLVNVFNWSSKTYTLSDYKKKYDLLRRDVKFMTNSQQREVWSKV